MTVWPFALLAVVEVVVLALSRDSSYYTSIALQWAAFALLAQGFNVIAGYAGRLAFGNTLFFGISAYLVVAGAVHDWYPPLAGLGIAVVASCVLAYLLSLGLWRVGGLLFALATFALAVMLEELVTVSSTFGAASGLQEPLAIDNSIVQLSLTSQYGYVVAGAVLVLLAAVVTRVFSRSTLGREVQATREDRTAAASGGIDTRQVSALTWMISAGITAVAGVFYAQFNLFVEPTSAFGLSTTTLIIVPAILGGLGTVWGPVVGSAIIPIGLLLTRLSNGEGIASLDLMIYGAILIVVMRLYPGGLTSAFAVLGEAYRRRRPTLPAPAAERSVAPRRSTAAEVRSATQEAPPAAVVRGGGREEGPLLEVYDVHKSFGGVQALQDVSFKVAPGEIVGLVGPNGAGKTTLFNCIAGVETPDMGEVRFTGRDISHRAAHERARAGISRTYQNVRLFPNLTALENVAVGSLRRFGAETAAKRAATMLHAVGLAARPDECAGSLSLVDQRRVELARAMVTDAPLIMLDEAMTGLDEPEVEKMRSVVRELNRQHATAFIIVEHVMGHVLPLISRVVIMERGRILADGDPEEALRRNDVLEAYFGRSAAGAVTNAT